MNFLHQNLALAARKSACFFGSNLTTMELHSLRWLRNEANAGLIVVCKADKGRQLVIANKRDYVNAVLSFICNSGNYKRTEFNAKFRTVALIRRVVAEFADLFDEQTKQVLLGNTNNPRSRQFYVLPKLHKSKLVWASNFPPVRPICPDVGTESSTSGKYLALVLAPVMQSCATYCKSSTSLLQQLYRLRNLNHSCVFLTADIDALYPSIKPVEAYDIVESELRIITLIDDLPQ